MEKQRNFENVLFQEPQKEEPKKEEAAVEPKEKSSEPYEIIKCQYCQDVGVCSMCERGKRELASRPKPDFFLKKRKKRAA